MNQLPEGLSFLPFIQVNERFVKSMKYSYTPFVLRVNSCDSKGFAIDQEPAAFTHLHNHLNVVLKLNELFYFLRRSFRSFIRPFLVS